MSTEWAAEQLRVSLFSSEALGVTEDDWCALTGQSEAETRRSIPGGRVFSGRFEGGLLNLSGVLNRTDIVFSAAPPEEASAEPQLPTTGSWESARDKFYDFAHVWVETRKVAVTRLAFGAVLLCETTDRKSSYEVLKSLLTSVEVVPDRMQELLYRVNWPTESGLVQGLKVNRVTSWSALEIRLATLEVTGSPHLVPSNVLNVVRLEIDNNTDADRTISIPQAQIGAVFKELITFASEIARNGEVK